MPNQLEGLLARLEDYEDEIPPEHVQGAVGALLDQFHIMREGPRGMFDLGPQMALDRVVLRLLRRIADENVRVVLVDTTLPTLRWLSAGRDLIGLMEGHTLAPKIVCKKWNRDLAARVVGALPQHLALERDLAALVDTAVRLQGEAARESLRTALDLDAVFLRFLRSGLSEQSSVPVGDVAVTHVSILPWEALETLIGDSRLLARVAEVHSRAKLDELDERSVLALKTAIRYSDGWRPRAYGRVATTAATTTSDESARILESDDGECAPEDPDRVDDEDPA